MLSSTTKPTAVSSGPSTSRSISQTLQTTFSADTGTTEVPVQQNTTITTIELSKTDDGTAEVKISESIPVFGVKHTVMYVSINGLISLGNNTVGYNPREFPINATDTVLIAPLWLDLDITNTTDAAVYVTTYENVRPKTNISSAWKGYYDNDFQPTWAAEVVWSHVPPFPANIYESKLNATFKTVLLTDGDKTYLFFDYDGNTSLPQNFARTPFIGWAAETNKSIYNETYDSGKSSAVKIFTQYGNTGEVGKWKFKLFNVESRYKNDSKVCRQWLEEETSDPVSSDEMPPCPCTLSQAVPDFRYRLSRNNCYELVSPTKQGYGLNCCYYSNSSQEAGSLRTGIRGPSAFYRYHHQLDNARHKSRDIGPRDSCCLLDKTCDAYYANRPVPSCNLYKPPVIAAAFGPPHIRTFDGLVYTFSGNGEFVMLNTPAGPTVQGRMENPWQNGDRQIPNKNATVFTAFAMTDSLSSKVTVQLNEKRKGIQVFVDGEEISDSKLADGNNRLFRNTTVYRDTNGCVVVVQTTGFSSKYCATEGSLSATFSSPLELVRNASGLLGSSNNNEADDLTDRGGDVIPTNATAREIFRHMSTWNISSTDMSIFHYKNGFGSRNYTMSVYSPVFLDELSSNANSTCGSDKSCLYDTLVLLEPKTASNSIDFKRSIAHRLDDLGHYERPLMGNVIINVTVNVTTSITVIKPSSSVNVSCSIPSDASCRDNGTKITFKWTPTTMDKTSISFVGKDSTRATTQSLDVLINFCNCQNNGTCRFDRLLLGQDPRSNFRIVSCDCMLGWTGHFCELDFDGCQGAPCEKRGQTCTDLLPEVHRQRKYPYECSVCTEGYQQIGPKCVDVDECFENSSVCGGDKQKCINQIGNYTCVCDDGYSLNGTSCVQEETTTLSRETSTETAVTITTDVGQNYSVNLGFEIKGEFTNETQLHQGLKIIFENVTDIDAIVIDTVHFNTSTNKTKLTFMVKYKTPVETKHREELANTLGNYAASEKPLQVGSEEVYISKPSPYIIVPTSKGPQKLPLVSNSGELIDRCQVYNEEKACKNGGNCTLNADAKPTCSCTGRYSGEYCQVEKVSIPEAKDSNELEKILLPVLAAVLATGCAVCCILAIIRKRKHKEEPDFESDISTISVRQAYGMPSSIFLPRFSSNWRQFSGPPTWNESMPTVHRTRPFQLPITYEVDDRSSSTPPNNTMDNISIDSGPAWYNNSVLADDDFFIDRPMFYPQPIYPHREDGAF